MGSQRQASQGAVQRQGAVAGGSEKGREGWLLFSTTCYIKMGMMLDRKKTGNVRGKGSCWAGRLNPGGGKHLAASTQVPVGRARGPGAGKGAAVSAEPQKEVPSGCSMYPGR